jgi:hypothetical protein
LDAGSPEARLVTLVRAMPALDRAPFAAERIFARVTSAPTRKTRLPWAAAAMAMGIGVSAVAAAAVGHWEGAGLPLASSPSGLSKAAPTPAAAIVAEVSRVVPETPSDPTVADVPQPSPSPKLKPQVRALESHRAAGEDPAPLLEAIRTLRSNGDPARAGVLLAEYLKAYPHSPLSEDAMALSIEAAIARHDNRAGADLARRYLTQFPNGRYRTFASKAAQSTPSTDNP